MDRSNTFTITCDFCKASCRLDDERKTPIGILYHTETPAIRAYLTFYCVYCGLKRDHILISPLPIV